MQWHGSSRTSGFSRLPASKTIVLFAGLMLFGVGSPRPVRSADELPSAGLTAQSQGGMVVSVSRPATEIGARVLEQGGNAVDAAVAVAFALAVTWPEAGNVGGGGFMLVYPGHEKSAMVIDYREKAPAATTVDMFAGGRSNPYLMVGVPGTVRGLELAHHKYGKVPWERLVLPAVKLAEDGFGVDESLATSLNKAVTRFRDNPAFLAAFGKDQGKKDWIAGDRLVQPDLAQTLRAIASQGGDAFYTGVTAELLEAEMKRGGGLVTQADLAAYQAKVRSPIHGTFRGFDVYAPPPPSSGGITLIQMLNLAEYFDLRQEPRWSARTMHLMIESMRYAYYNRARYLGDPDFVEIPEKLTSKDYANELAKTVSLDRAGCSATLGAEILSSAESSQTTHFSVIDREGMAVSNTYTLENAFGSGIVVRSAGFLLNDEMGDFNPQPGVTSPDGRIGTPPNLAAPGKRMLSSMCPVVVAEDGRAVLITGSPGGRTIINTVFCLLINVLEYGMPLRDAVDAPRHHHQWMPDRVQIEPALQADQESMLDRLRAMGHEIQEPPERQGDAHSIAVDPATGLKLGVADRRRGGWASGADRSSAVP